MKKIQVVILFVSFLVSATGRSETYQAYFWLDQQLRDRKLPEKEAMAVLKSETPQFVSFDQVGVRMQFYKKIGDRLSDLAGLTRNDLQEPIIPSTAYCGGHDKAEQDLKLWIQLAASNQANSDCNQILQSMNQVIAQSDLACKEISTPKIFIKNEFARTRPKMVKYLGKFYPNAFSPTELKLENLKDYIVVAGAQLITVSNYPEAVVSESFQSQVKQIFKKIWNQEFLSKAQSSMSLSEQLIKKLAASPLACKVDSQKAISALRTYSSEQATIISDLQRIQNDGLKQAELDRQKILATGRQREILPYPSLTDSEREFIAIYLGGIYWRMRGGGLWSRLVGSESGEYYNLIPLQLVGEMAGGEVGKDVGEGLHNRASLGYSRFMDMGRANDDKYSDLVGMTKRGYFQIGVKEESLVSGLEYFFRFGRFSDAKGVLKENKFENNFTRVGGAHMGICYFYAYENTYQKVQIGKDIVFLPEGGTDVGELCTGSALNLGMVKSLLSGHL